MNNQNPGIGLLVPALLNPAIGAAIGIGFVGFGLYKLLTDEDLEERDDNAPQEPTDETVTPSDGDVETDLELRKEEMIRQAMSELGKRSATARAKKKDDAL